MARGSPPERSLDLRLASDSDAPRVARQALIGWAPPDVLPEAQLVMSELVANAVLHAGMGEDGAIAVRAQLSRDRLRLEVEDTGSGFASRRVSMPPPGSSGGRGLPIVASLARCWGVGPHRVDGFRVWASLVWGAAKPRGSLEQDAGPRAR